MPNIETDRDELRNNSKNIVHKRTVPVCPKSLSLSAQAGIWNVIFIIFGFPTEMYDDFVKTTDFIKRNKNIINSINCGIFGLPIHSRVWKNPERYNINNIIPDESLFQLYENYQLDKMIDHNLVENYKDFLDQIRKIDYEYYLGFCLSRGLLFSQIRNKKTELFKKNKEKWELYSQNDKNQPLLV